MKVEISSASTRHQRAAMMDMMCEGILALPGHDSFIVSREERGRLEEVMKRAYRDRTGFEIEVKEA